MKCTFHLPLPSPHVFTMCICVWVSVYVCEREREVGGGEIITLFSILFHGEKIKFGMT